ncbi:head-tail connector protein [Aeromonas veronii]
MIITKLEKIDNERCITLDEAKAYIRVFDADDDAVITMHIKVALDNVEQYTNRKLQLHNFELSGDVSRCQIIDLPYGNNTVTEITANTIALVKDVDYKMIGNNGVYFVNANTNVVIKGTCGYQFDKVPDMLRNAVLMKVGTYYECRQDVTFGVQTYKAELTSDRLMQPYVLYNQI